MPKSRDEQDCKKIFDIIVAEKFDWQKAVAQNEKGWTFSIQYEGETELTHHSGLKISYQKFKEIWSYAKWA